MLEHHEPGTLAEAYALDGVADLDDFDPLLDAWDIYRHDRGRGYN
jgi:hypothetical protein